MILKLGDVYRKEQSGLLRYIYSKISDVSASEDILHDVFVKAAESANIMEPIENISGWLYQVARNKVIDHYRKYKNKKFSHVSLSLEREDSLTLEDLIYDSGINIEKDFTRQQVSEEIITALDSLPEAQREVFILQAVDGISFKEISELTGVSINTLLARKRYAVNALRSKLEYMKELLKEIQ